MNAISSRFYQTLVERLNQMNIRGNRHKVSVFAHLSPDQSSSTVATLSQDPEATAVFAFHLMFERNNADSPWRLLTPLKFID